LSLSQRPTKPWESTCKKIFYFKKLSENF